MLSSRFKRNNVYDLLIFLTV